MSTEPHTDLDLTPAAPADLPFIRETVERLRLDPEDLDPAQFVTLRRGGRIVAFGRIKPYRDAHELGSVAVLDAERGRGLGARIVRELIRRFPTDEVFITTDIPAYFERLGFLRTAILPAEIEAKIQRVCASLRPATTGMVYDRIVERLPTLADTYRAARRIAPHLARTPLVHSPALSRALGCAAHLKLENVQPTGAFKVRGGVYLAATLGADERRRGIIAASTGNHGQSIAYGAKLLGIPCTIAVPREANPMKVEAMRVLGAEVVHEGADFEAARRWAEQHAHRAGLRYVHHINTPELIAGVSTISLEILEDLPDVDVIIVPIGGGSGALGHCLVAKALRPEVQIIGVQAEAAPAVHRSWKERRLQTAPIATAAEGVATGQAYYVAVRTLIDHLTDFVLVSETAMREAIALVLSTAHVVAEDAAAATVAAVPQLGDRIKDRRVALVISGGNLTLDRLRHVLQA